MSGEKEPKTASEIVGAALLRKIERLESVESENAALKEEIKRLEGLLIEDEIIMTSDSEEIAALKTALSELMPLADGMVFEMRGTVDDESVEKAKAAIDRAKKLIAVNRE